MIYRVLVSYTICLFIIYIARDRVRLALKANCLFGRVLSEKATNVIVKHRGWVVYHLQDCGKNKPYTLLLSFRHLFVHACSGFSTIAHSQYNCCTTAHDVATSIYFGSARLHAFVYCDGVFATQF